MGKTNSTSKVKNKSTKKSNYSYRNFLKKYLDNSLDLKTYQKFGIGSLIFVIAGFIGWTYEFFLAWFEKGQIYMKGGNFLPWINIYAIGAIILIPIVWKLKKYPWAVFLASALTTGILELIAGWLVYNIGNGTRYWNYNEGLWTIGSINGFVCLLSVTCFGLSALLLAYVVLPFCTYLSFKMSRQAFLTLAVSLLVIILADELTNLTLKNLGQPTAMDFYRSLGLEYQNF